MDTLAKIITAGCFLLVGFVAYKTTFLAKVPVILGIFLILLTFGSLIIAFLYAPQKYIVQNGALFIVRPINKIEIPLSDIKEARLISRAELGTLFRIWGSGGFFGYFGVFRSTRIGKIRLYTTRRDNRILINTTDDERILLSPDDTSLLNALKGSF